MQRLNPATLLPPPAGRFAHAVVAPVGARLAFVAGQVALDVEGRLIGEGDYRAQARQAYANLRLVVEALGAGPGDIVQLTIYVAGYTPELLGEIDAGGDEAFGADWPVAATTLVGVERLGIPGFLVEVAATVAIRS